METEHVCHSGFSLHILGGGWTKAHDPKGRDYDDCMGKARAKKATEFCRLCCWGLSIRTEWAPRDVVNVEILSETWIDKMQWFFDIYTKSQDPAYMFKEDDFTSFVEPPGFAAMMETASEFTQARGWLFAKYAASFCIVLRIRLYQGTLFQGNGHWSTKKELHHITIFVKC